MQPDPKQVPESKTVAVELSRDEQDALHCEDGGLGFSTAVRDTKRAVLSKLRTALDRRGGDAVDPGPRISSVMTERGAGESGSPLKPGPINEFDWPNCDECGNPPSSCKCLDNLEAVAAAAVEVEALEDVGLDDLASFLLRLEGDGWKLTRSTQPSPEPLHAIAEDLYKAAWDSPSKMRPHILPRFEAVLEKHFGSGAEPSPGSGSEERTCPFCDYGGPSPILRETGGAIVFEPLDPVAPGHILVVPKAHLSDFAADPLSTGEMFRIAAEVAADLGDCNLITSKGPAATQTVGHLHVHVVPRREGDGLALPWTTDLRERLEGLANEFEQCGAKDRAEAKQTHNDSLEASGEAWEEAAQALQCLLHNGSPQPESGSGEEGKAIPRDYWREVPCGHPADPVAMYSGQGDPVCHCGRILDLADRMAELPPEAPGPIVYCQQCGCYVAIPPKPAPTQPLQGSEVERELPELRPTPWWLLNWNPGSAGKKELREAVNGLLTETREQAAQLQRVEEERDRVRRDHETALEDRDGERARATQAEARLQEALGDDGPIFLTIREALGDAVDGYGWHDVDGFSMHPNDPSVEQAGDEICAAVKEKLRSQSSSEVGNPDCRCESIVQSVGAALVASPSTPRDEEESK